MKAWNISNPHLEAWGPFGRGWASERFSAQVLEPTTYPIIAYPTAWSESTNGIATGPVIYVQMDSESDLRKYQGKLKGAWIMRRSAPGVQPHFRPDATRLSDSALLAMAAAQLRPQLGRRAPQAPPGLEATVIAFLRNEGALGVLETNRADDDGTVFVSGSGYQIGTPKRLPTIMLAAEHYGRIFRTIQKGVQVKLEVESQTRVLPIVLTASTSSARSRAGIRFSKTKS